MLPRRTLTLLIAGMLFTLACTGQPASAPPAGGPSGTTAASPVPVKKTVRVAYSAQTLDPSLSQIYAVPKYLGYWDEEGLEVDFSLNAGCGNSMQLLIAGSADVSHNCWLTAAQAVEKGEKVIGYFNLSYAPVFVPAVTEDSPIKTVRDLKGKRIGVQSLGAAMAMIVKGVAGQEGLDPERDLIFVGVGLGGAPAAALKGNQIDALGFWPAVYAQVESTTGTKLRQLEPEKFKVAALSTGLIVRSDYFEGHPDTLVRLARGMAKAAIFVRNNPEAAVRITWQVFPETKPRNIGEEQVLKEGMAVVQAQSYALDRPKGSPWGHVSNEELAGYMDFFRRGGVLTTKLPPEQMFSDRLLAQINQFDEAQVVRQAKQFAMKER